MYERVLAKNLLHRHEEYLELKDAWEQLHDMERGTPAVLRRREFYLPKKVGEDYEEYQNRLAKIAYTPHLANAIRETTAKLAAAPLHVENANSEYWEYVRTHLDGKQQNEGKFIKDVFSSLCYYGRVYTVVDRDPIAELPLSKAEQLERLRLDKLYPTVKVLNPLSVTDWNLDENWFVITTISEQYAPLQAPKTVATWKLYTPTETWTYSAVVQLVNGQVSSVWQDNPAIQGGGMWRSVYEDDLYLEGNLVIHGMGVNPVNYVILKDELWVGGLAYLEQVQHIRVNSQLMEAAYIAGTVVRLFTPTTPPERSPKALLSGNTAPKADHSHTLVGDKYEFVESTGGAIDNLLKVLKNSEMYIQSVASLDYKRKDSAQMQSADSKQIDTSLVEDVMKMLGAECKYIYQGTLDRFSILDGQAPVVVQGLENYGTDTLDQMLAQSETIEALDSAGRIPLTALKLWYSRLTSLIAGDTFGEIEKQLIDEIDALFEVAESDEEEAEFSLEALKELMDAYGLTIEQAAYVLTGEGEGEGAKTE